MSRFCSEEAEASFWGQRAGPQQYTHQGLRRHRRESSSLVLRLSNLLFIIARTTCEKEFEFQIDRYRNVGYLKQRIKKEGKGFVDVEVEDHELFCNGEELDDQRVFQDIYRNDEDVVYLLVQKSSKGRTTAEKDLEVSVVGAACNEIAGVDLWLEPVVLNPKAEFFPFLWDMINSTLEGLKKGNYPIRSSEGTRGTYLMQDGEGEEYVSVFKPADEEPMAVNNPRGLPRSCNGEGLKRGTKVGEGAARDVAAFTLDHPRSGPRPVTGEAMGFAGVPPTVMVRCVHQELNVVKMGSLQKLVKNDGKCENIGANMFSVEEVHKITVLDIRMANADRHAGNILYRKEGGGRMALIPIDHGYYLPEKAQRPYSADTVDYINSLDAEKDKELVKYYGWDVPEECARTLRISTMLLKKGIERS